MNPTPFSDDESRLTGLLPISAAEPIAAVATPSPEPSCPRCGALVSPGTADCAHCGIVFAKYMALQARRPAQAVPAPPGAGPLARIEDGPDGVVEDGALDPSVRALVVARAVLWLGLAAWTVAFARHDVASNYAGESALHLVNLVFHEAGHVVFAPFGQFVTVLGGSLLQVMVPLLCAGALLNSGDRFGATVGLWWAGQNLVDLAPYIADARALRLVLLGGRTGAEVEGHDWEHLLSALGWLPRDHALAQAAHLTGVGVMVVALCLGGLALARQRRLDRQI